MLTADQIHILKLTATDSRKKNVDTNSYYNGGLMLFSLFIQICVSRLYICNVHFSNNAKSFGMLESAEWIPRAYPEEKELTN